MFEPNFVTFYAKSATVSVALYADLPGKAPVEASPTFAMFALNTGMTLGLWASHTVEPAAAAAGDAEIAFAVNEIEGLKWAEIRAKLDCSDSYIDRWSKRFAADRLAGAVRPRRWARTLQGDRSD